MSIASRIQEIETHIGDVYDTINYSYDTTGINKNIINIPKYLKKGYIDIINNGIDTLYNNFPKVSGIGSNLSLTPTYEAPMKLNEIQGDTLQDGTPTPNTPVEIQSVTGLQNVEVCGKNLLDASQSVNGYINSSGGIGESNYDLLSDYIKVESGKNYTISLNTQFYNIGYAFYDSSKTYILRYNTNRNVTTLTTTIPSGTSYIRVWFNYNGTTTLTPANILQYEPMIEQGSATTYEPYKGNTYEVNLGKNLFDKDNANILNAYINSNGNSSDYKKIISNNNSRTIYISCKSNTTYTVSKIAGQRFVVASCNNVPEVNVLCTNEVHDQTGASLTITTGANDKYLVVFYYLSTADTSTEEQIRNSIQIEVGSQATSYSPYFTPIELNKIGDYKDSIKKSTGKNIITTYNYASSGYINYNYDNSKIGKTMTYSFIPNFSTTNASLYIRANTSISSYKVGTISTITSGTKVSVTFTLTDEQYNTIKNTNGGYIQVYKSGVSMDENSISNPMLEINSQSTSYEPYGKVWYVEKQIGKVVLNGSEGWGLASTYTNNTRFSSSSLILGKTTNLISNYFVEGQGGTDTTNIDTNGTTGALMITIPNNIASTLSEFTTWLSTHNTEVLYVLATPEYTEITNTELIEDLETLYTAKSQEGTTNISITSEDLEMILNVSALKGEV